jgi:hypothetical protein
MVASRRVWQGVEFGLLGLAVGLLVSGARLVVQTAVVHVPVADPAAQPTSAAALPPLAAYAVIERRNIFGRATGDRASTPSIILRGVGMHAGVIRAAIEDPVTHVQRLAGVGDPVGDGQVAAITWDHLTIASPNGDTTVQLAAPGHATPAPVPAGGDTALTPSPGGVRRTGANAFIVDRRELATALDGMSGLMSQLRAVAEIEDGRPAGFRVFQIAEQSLFTQLGLSNGDVVQRVNGKPVTDPAALLGFLKQLRTEPRVALDIVRAGAARTLVYDLR